MGIVSSKIMKIWPQVLGQHDYWVRHTDHIGGVHDRFWAQNSAMKQAALDALLQSQAKTIDAELIDQECEDVRAKVQAGIVTPEQTQDDKYPLHFATKIQVANRIINFFVKEGIYEFRKIITWINGLSDKQISELSSLTQEQVDKIQARASAIITNNDFLESDLSLTKEAVNASNDVAGK